MFEIMLQPELWIARLPIVKWIAHPHLKMQMRTEGNASRTDPSQARLVTHDLTRSHMDLFQVPV